MSYLPKSKYSKKYTNGGLLVYSNNKKEYIGDYIETSNGQFSAGTALGGPPLQPMEKGARNMDGNKRARLYNRSQTGMEVYSDLSKKTNIPTSKPQPTEQDYHRGYFVRHFIEKVNEPNRIFETSLENLKKLKSKLDTNLYNIDNTEWVLKGEKATFNNEAKILSLNKDYPYISAIFSKPDEYVQIEEELNLNKLKNPNDMLDEIPTFTLEQWNMFNSLDKEKLILKYGEVNISDL